MFILGVDIGQVQDPTAAVIIQAVRDALHVRHIERFPIGLSYPAVVERVDGLRRATPRCRLVVDATGVGRPVVDALREKGDVVAVSITGGRKVRRRDGAFHVPKAELVRALARVMEAGRLKVAKGLPMAAALVSELKNFAVAVSARGHARFEAKAGHDDIVLALALAVWFHSFQQERRAW